MKSKSKNTPIYSGQIEGAANDLTSAYRATQPGLQANADRFGGVVNSAIDRYEAGDPNIDAARGYDADVLGGKYLGEGNPYLADQITRTNNNVRNQAQASFGSRGLTNGSDYYLGIADRLAANESNLRYQDYGNERSRMDAASGRAPGLIAGENALLDPAVAGMDAQQAPLRAAAGYAGGVGGLLGQYQNQVNKGSVAGLLASLAQSAATAYAGGGK